MSVRRRLLGFVAVLGLATAISGCGDGSDDIGTAEVVDILSVDEAMTTNGEIRDVEGSISVRDGDSVRMCRRIDFSGPAPVCAAPYLQVESLDLDAVPRLSRAGDVRFAWPSILVRGRVDDGVLTVTEMPPVYRISVVGAPSVLLDRSGTSREIQLSAGQTLGVIGDWHEFRSRSVRAGKGVLRLSMPECPDDADCIGGWVAVDTTGMRPGEYVFDENGVHVVLRVTADPSPGSTSTEWSLPSTNA